MKTFILILATVMPAILFGQCNPQWFGTLRAEVTGHQVVLWNDTTTRECGRMYNMKIHHLSGDTLVWMQKDVAPGTNCLCEYNLSATIDSLKTGNYIAKVYYSEMFQTDSCYIGSVSFNITEPFPFYSPYLLDQYQSSCLVTGISTVQVQSEMALKVFPNPAEGVLNIATELKGPKFIRISDIENRTIVEIQTDEEEITLDVSYLPAKMYFVTVRNDEKSLHAGFLKI